MRGAMQDLGAGPL